VLLDAFPRWGFWGEETGRRDAENGETHWWLVDPDDGTSAFLKGHRGFAVSIALVRNGGPVLGVVYAPCSPDDGGDLFAWAQGCGPLVRNGKSAAGARSSDIVLLSKGSEGKPSVNARLIEPFRFIASPSIAYRLALAAANGGATVSMNRPSGYDYAGGHALLGAAGGVFVDESKRPVRYGSDGSSSVKWCFGGEPRLVEKLVGLDWNEVLSATRETCDPYPPVFPCRGTHIADPGVLSRAHGCLLGQVAGDSLGSLVEFQTPDAISRSYEHGVRTLADGGTFDTIAGQPTDDSELALMLARSTIAEGRYDVEAAARAYYYWYCSRPFDMGGTTAAALGAMREAAGDCLVETSIKHTGTGFAETSPKNAGTGLAEAARASARRESKANGSLMRISPLGVWGWARDPAEVAQCARQDSDLTHPNATCRDACAVYAVALAYAIGSGREPQDVYDFTVRWARDSSLDSDVLAALDAAASSPPPDFTRSMGFVLTALQNAFYRLLHGGSLEEGVVETVMAGGDTDTNAAIAGALLGAVHGREAVPLQWREAVLSCRPLLGLRAVRKPRPRPFWPVDLLEIAERLAFISMRNS
jgi:ADP-ribosylglycohydrolase/fructose-1,6-bisphosphatase/inositol monophosphatase family enzyme